MKKMGEQQVCVSDDVGLAKEESSKVGEVAYIEQILHIRFEGKIGCAINTTTGQGNRRKGCRNKRSAGCQSVCHLSSDSSSVAR